MNVRLTCDCPPDECHVAGSPGCYFGIASEHTAEFDALRAKVARVEALAEEWESVPVEGGRWFKHAAQRLRSALSEPRVIPPEVGHDA